MHPPCLRDLATPEEEIPDTDVALTLLFEVEYMFAQTEFDEALKAQTEELAALHQRKASILCLLDKPGEAKASAEEAVSLYPSASTYYRLGVCQYLLSDFEAASTSFRAANRLDPASAKISLALTKLSVRMCSRKDRSVFINTEPLVF